MSTTWNVRFGSPRAVESSDATITPASARWWSLRRRSRRWSAPPTARRLSVIALVVAAGCGDPARPISPDAGPRQGVAGAQTAAVTLAGAGDIAHCLSPFDELTADLLDRLPDATVFTAGDNAYPDGTAEDFRDCYEPSWGRHKARTRPSPGNHEYYSDGAAPYFAYFGANAGDPAKGYYSYDAGAWHVVVLNSAAAAGPGSAQLQWLHDDLTADAAAHPKRRCTLAYWHHPVFSSSQYESPRMADAFRVLYEAGADLVVAGHHHAYERFAPQDPGRRLDRRRGIREFVVGTGGAGLHPFQAAKANSEVRDNTNFGVLKLVLRGDGYDWQFLRVGGATGDRGTDRCH